MSSVVTRTDAQRNSQSLPPRAVGSDITDATCLSASWPVASRQRGISYIPEALRHKGFLRPTYSDSDLASVPFSLHSSTAAHSHCGGIVKSLIGCLQRR